MLERHCTFRSAAQQLLKDPIHLEATVIRALASSPLLPSLVSWFSHEVGFRFPFSLPLVFLFPPPCAVSALLLIDGCGLLAIKADCAFLQSLAASALIPRLHAVAIIPLQWVLRGPLAPSRLPSQLASSSSFSSFSYHQEFLKIEDPHRQLLQV